MMILACWIFFLFFICYYTFFLNHPPRISKTKSKLFNIEYFKGLFFAIVYNENAYSKQLYEIVSPILSVIDPDITPQPIAPGPSICGIPNYIQISGICLRLEPELLTFEEAEKSCTEEGGHLATAPDGYIDGFLQFLVSVNQTVSSAWIGLSDVAVSFTSN